ncbi:MAG: ABC-F family ATP-binding cassette domain-containing protein [Candidatus Izemoplasmatales bacterium]
MSLLKIQNLKKSFAGDLLFENVDIDVSEGEKVALIGQNGVGKSTIVKIILGETEADFGEVAISRQAHIGYLSQDVLEDENRTMHAELLSVYAPLLRLEAEIALAAERLERDHDEVSIGRYARLEEEYVRLGGYDFRVTIDTMLSRFGFAKDEYDRVIRTFSGGEKTRIAFAKLLLQKPELLILDEPTNHMDIEIIEWLEDYLRKYPGAVLVVTHDKYFINRVATKIYEIDQRTASVYHGNFDAYEVEKVRRYEALLGRYNRQAKEIAHLQSFVDRFRYKATKAKSAQDRIKKLARIERIDKPTTGHAEVRFGFRTKRPTEAVILETEDLSIGYDRPLQEHLSLSMRGFDKIGVIGPNGIGKTTLIKTLIGTIPPFAGEVVRHKALKIGYFDQNLAGLNETLTVLSTIHDRYPTKTVGEVRGLLARFLFVEDDVYKPVSVLSGGEKVRLVLLLLMLEEPEMLILDEPTNHLDIETKNIVEDVFDDYDGPILFISHDRYFINKVATKIIWLKDGGTVVFDGDYDAFKAAMAARPEEKTVRPTRLKSTNAAAEIRRLEARIDALHGQIETMKQSLFDPAVYGDAAKYREVAARIAEAETEADGLFEKVAALQD